MTLNESSKEWALPVFNPTDFAKLGKQQADALMEMQQELSKLVEQANNEWLARVELEREMAAELTAKLSASKSLPDAAKAYQEWMSRRMETMSKDSQKFLADGQKLVTSMSRFMTSGMNGSGA